VPRPRRQTPPLHLTAYYQTVLRALGIEPAAPVPRLAPTPRMRARAAALLETAGVDPRAPLVGIAPGAAYGYAKRWRGDRYARVVTRLVRDRSVQVVLVGSGHDRDAGHAIESSLASEPSTAAGVTNLIGRTDLSQLVGLLARCQGFISSDSGGMHLAAALGVRVTAIFGPTDERLTAPVGSHAVLSHAVWCRPCFFRECPIDHRCMTGITADQVFEAVAASLPRHEGRHS
jgi:heptosyltransferase-2